LQQFLHRQGVEKWQSWLLALSGKGYWRKSGCPQSNQAMGKEWFQQLGLYNLTFHYKTLNHLAAHLSQNIKKADKNALFLAF
jgi:hypothetical protein